MTRYFRDETGMYIDWAQLDKLPEIDTLIDIGVGPMGTPELYSRFPEAKLILIDPLLETQQLFEKLEPHRDVVLHDVAVGEKDEKRIINVEEEIGRSTLCEVSDINFEGEPVEKREVQIVTLDSVICDVEKPFEYGKLGIKIDTEGFELSVVKGSAETLKHAKFVLAEVRHNHTSFYDSYTLHEFVYEMHKHGFILSMIMTAKPFIADLCFQKESDLKFK